MKDTGKGVKFVGQGCCEDVLTYPLRSASVYHFCSSAPELQSRFLQCLPHGQPTLRLAHWLRLLANESLALSGIVRYLSTPSPMLGAHSTFASGGVDT
ncbi:MAG: hypothetical protein IM602_05355 [Cytophagales bacterium]|nr:hypothetical protein [Cytophagales bacterium]MCA6425058.1 hypothetical protein [Cytophagales bacterium]MCA6491643.1 hypothetical protein [Chitinophagaceae bacterium]